MRTFLSYSRDDAAFVTQVAEKLEGRGIDVWVDTDDIRGSERWRHSIAVRSPPLTRSEQVPPVDSTLRRSPGSARGSRLRRSVIAAAAVVVVGIAALSRLGDDNNANTASVGEVAASATDLAADDEATQVVLDATVWFAGFEISASSTRYDPVEDQVVVDTEIANTQRVDGDPVGLFVGSTSVLEVGGRRLTVDCDGCVRLPPGARVSAALTADFVESIRLDEAVLVFGGPQQHQAMIPLGGVIDDQEAATFEVQHVEVVPAACSGIGEQVGFSPGRRDEMSVVVVGTATASSDHRINLGEATLVLPDGSGPYAS